MILKLLGAIDIGLAIMLLLITLDAPIVHLYILFAILHAIKAVLFIKNFLSIVDIAIALYTLIAPFWPIPIVNVFVIGFLAYKGLYSMA